MISRSFNVLKRHLGISFAVGLMASASAFAQPNIVIHDCGGDVGNEPDNACPVYWNSQDIKCQTSPVYSATLPHRAQAGVDNYIFVTLKNIGDQDLTSGMLYVYWAKMAATQVWPSGWINHHDAGGNLIGDVIDSVVVDTIRVDSTKQLRLTWPAAQVLDPSTFHEASTHICMVARFVSSQDPMTFAEGSNMLTNTQNNNNIAWRNCDVAEKQIPVTTIIVGNPLNTANVISLHFDETPSGAGNSFLNYGTMTVDLGAQLYQEWINSGGISSNVGAIAGSTQVTITGSPARLDNIQMNANEEYTISVYYSANDDQALQIGSQTFDWNIAEFMNGDVDPFGGVTSTVDWNSSGSQGDGKRAVAPDASAGTEYQLSARPNPTSSSTTISYMLPEDGSVTLSIYDANGHMVRTLADAVDQKKGAHEIEWNGQTAGGTNAAAGTYFYRLEANHKTVEGQLKIVR